MGLSKLKKVLAERVAGVKRQRRGPRRDEALPFGLGLGARVEIDEGTLALLRGHLQARLPEGGQPYEVEAWGRSAVGDWRVDRFYLAESDAFLELAGDAALTGDDAVESSRLYTLDHVEHPTRWGRWLDEFRDGTEEEEAIVGSPSLCHGDFEYWREWMAQSDAEAELQAAPVVMSEEILLDPWGERIHRETQKVMSYLRTAYGDPGDPEDPERIDEYLYVEVGDGVAEMHLGVAIDPRELVVYPPAET